MKILLLNEGYSDNLGDQVINDSLHYLLKNNGIINIDFQDFTKNINKPREISIKNKKTIKFFFILKILKKIVPSKIKWLIQNINRVIKISRHDYDLVIIGGGQLILSNATFSIAMFLWIFLLKSFRNKKIILFAVGSGTKFNFLDKILYQYILKSVSKIYVRDHNSKKILKYIFDIDTTLVYDVAFIHSRIFNKVRNPQENILLGVISFDVYKRYNKNNISEEYFFETWIQLLNKNSINIENIQLFYTTQSDRTASLKFKNYISSEYQIDLEIVETSTKDKLIDELNKAKLVISARMHALILGFTYKCEIITYPVSDKLIEFDRMIHDNHKLENIQNNIEIRLKEILYDK